MLSVAIVAAAVVGRGCIVLVVGVVAGTSGDRPDHVVIARIGHNRQPKRGLILRPVLGGIIVRGEIIAEERSHPTRTVDVIHQGFDTFVPFVELEVVARRVVDQVALLPRSAEVVVHNVVVTKH